VLFGASNVSTTVLFLTISVHNRKPESFDWIMPVINTIYENVRDVRFDGGKWYSGMWQSAVWLVGISLANYVASHLGRMHSLWRGFIRNREHFFRDLRKQTYLSTS
jgi:hypothetical protein